MAITGCVLKTIAFYYLNELIYIYIYKFHYSQCYTLFVTFILGEIKRAPFHSGMNKNDDVSNQNLKETKHNPHWGSTIRRRFLNSNGVSLTIDESSAPLIFSLNDHDHDGLCIGTR